MQNDPAEDQRCQGSIVKMAEMPRQLMAELIGKFRDRCRGSVLERIDFGVGFLVNSRATADAVSLLHPLDDLQGAAPTDDFGNTTGEDSWRARSTTSVLLTWLIHKKIWVDRGRFE